MNSRNEAAVVKVDVIKLVAAATVVAAGIGAFYYFAGESLLFRVIGLLACVIVAILISLQTERGRAAWTFIQEAQNEVRMVVWPTRQETMHTTGIVILMVVIFALILWALDVFLGWLIKLVFGQ